MTQPYDPEGNAGMGSPPDGLIERLREYGKDWRDRAADASICEEAASTLAACQADVKFLAESVEKHVALATHIAEQRDAAEAKVAALTVANAEQAAMLDGLNANISRKLVIIAALRTALEDMLDDMGEDGLCVCPAAKTQALNTFAALGEG